MLDGIGSKFMQSKADVLSGSRSQDKVGAVHHNPRRLRHNEMPDLAQGKVAKLGSD